MRKLSSLMITLMVIVATFMIVSPSNVKASTGNILYVGGSGPGNYTKIQDAIDNASDGDVIFVYSGTYYENVIVNKSINLIGENENTTVIDGNLSGDVVKVTANYVTISRFTVQNSGNWSNAGINLHSVQHCRIEHVKASNNEYGIYLYNSTNCTITNCTVSNSTYGIGLRYSTNCIITNTTMVDNGIVIDGNDITRWNTHTIDTSNMVNGKPVYYWKNVNGGTIPAGAGQIILANCTNVTIENQNVRNTSIGIEIGFSSHCSITDATANNNELGIGLAYSTNCTITNSTASNNLGGILLFSSNNCTITNCTASNNKYGVELSWCSNNCTIINSNTSDNHYGIVLWDSVINCSITSCIVNNNQYGIYLSSSTNNMIANNIIISNTKGLYLNSYSNDNLIYNNFFNNTINAEDDGYNNIWNISKTLGTNIIGGPYLGGNYWSDYTGIDINGDGIGDTEVPHNGDYIYIGDTKIVFHGDYLPLTTPNYAPVANFTYSPTDPKVGDTITFNASSSHDPDGEIVNYTWDFGDGNISYGEIVTHAYSSAGIYNVTLTVRDDIGAENSTTLQIHIAINDTNPPSITIQKPQSRNLYILGRTFKFLLPNPWVIGKLEVKVNAGDKSGIEKVEFYLDGKLKYTDTSYPYSYTFKERSFGKLHAIKVKAYDVEGNSASKEIKVRWFCFKI